MNMGTISRYGAGVADMDRDRGILLVFLKWGFRYKEDG